MSLSQQTEYKAELQDGTLEKYSDEVHEMIREQFDFYSNLPVSSLTHQQMLVLSKAVGLLPVHAQSVILVLDKLSAGCECQQNCTKHKVEAAREMLAKLLIRATSIDEVIGSKKNSVALSYVQSVRDEKDLPHYHSVICKSIRGHYGVSEDEALPEDSGIWFDQLAKYQNQNCRNSAWGKIGNLPYMDLPVLTILPMCCEVDAGTAERATIPLLEKRFPLDAYLRGAIRLLSETFMSPGKEESLVESVKHPMCPFLDEILRFVGPAFIRTALTSCTFLYGKQDGNLPVFPIFSPWFRTWPMMERFIGNAFKGLYMDPPSWHVATLVAVIMDVIGTAMNESASSSFDSTTTPLVDDVERLFDDSMNPFLDKFSDRIVRLQDLTPNQLREYHDLLDEVYRTILHVQFRTTRPDGYSRVITNMEGRLKARGIKIVGHEPPSPFDWTDSLLDPCSGEAVLDFIRSSFVTHADIFTVADKVDVALGLICGLGGSNDMAKVESSLFYEKDSASSPLVAHESSRMRVVETALIAGHERANNDIPLLSLAPLVTLETIAVWMKVYLAWEDDRILRSQLALKDRVCSHLKQVGGFLFLVHPDMSCQFLFCSSRDLQFALDGLTQCPLGTRSSNNPVHIYGTVHFALFRDSLGCLVSFLWLVAKMHVTETESGTTRIWEGKRVTHQLSWRRYGPDDVTNDDQVHDESRETLKHELESMPESAFISSNTVIFWRDGRLASGLPMEHFVAELRKGVYGVGANKDSSGQTATS